MEEPSSVIGIFGSIILLLVTFTLTNFVKPWADRKNRSEEQEEKPPAPVIGEPIMENAEDMWRRIHSESMQDLDDLRKKLADAFPDVPANAGVLRPALP